MTDMTLSDGTEVSIDGKLIADATAAGKRVALDQAISGAEAAGAACRALVVYGPGPVATGATRRRTQSPFSVGSTLNTVAAGTG